MIGPILYSRLLVSLVFASLTSTYFLRGYMDSNVVDFDGTWLRADTGTSKISTSTHGEDQHQLHEQQPLVHVVYTFPRTGTKDKSASVFGSMKNVEGFIKAAEISIASIREHSTGPIQFYFQFLESPPSLPGTSAGALDNVIYLNATNNADAFAFLTMDDLGHTIGIWTLQPGGIHIGNDIDRVVFLDPDTELYCDIYSLVLGAFDDDIRNNNSNRFHDHTVAAVPSFEPSKKGGHLITGLSKRGVALLHLQDLEMTFRDGLIIVNVERWKSQNVSYQIQNLAKWNQDEDLFFEDEICSDSLSSSYDCFTTALKVVVRDRFHPLPASWIIPAEKIEGVKMTDDVRSNICMLHNPHGASGSARVKADKLRKKKKSYGKSKAKCAKYSDLFICRHFPSACKPGEKRLRDAVKAGAKMYSSVWIIGGWWTSMLAFVCFGFGIFISNRVDVDDSSCSCCSGGENNVGDNIKRRQTSSICHYEQVSQHTVVERSPSRVPASIAATFSTAARRHWMKLCAYWTDSELEPFTEPLLTFKAFISLLLFIELNVIMAPEQSMLTTPEIVHLHRGNYPYQKKHVYPWAKLLMPGLKNNGVVWEERLQQVRTLLLCSWLLFLLVPKKNRYIGAASYSCGAVAYVYLGCIGLQYNLAHSTQGAMLFILCAIPAIPFLSSRRCNHWLRKILYVGVLGPIYLFSGICKVRYKGIKSNITGEWMRAILEKQKSERVHLKAVQNYLANHAKIPSCIMSWGNIVTELVLPICIIPWTHMWQLQLLFHFAEVLFHVSIFLLIGPNFVRYCLLHLLASNPLGYSKQLRVARGLTRQCASIAGDLSRSAGSRRDVGDWIRVSWALIVLIGWWYVQLKSDVLHLSGVVPTNKRVNPYFPWPELSMFAKPTEDANIVAGIILTISTAFIQIVAMVR